MNPPPPLTDAQWRTLFADCASRMADATYRREVGDERLADAIDAWRSGQDADAERLAREAEGAAEQVHRTHHDRLPCYRDTAAMYRSEAAIYVCEAVAHAAAHQSPDSRFRSLSLLQSAAYTVPLANGRRTYGHADCPLGAREIEAQWQAARAAEIVAESA